MGAAQRTAAHGRTEERMKTTAFAGAIVTAALFALAMPSLATPALAESAGSKSAADEPVTWSVAPADANGPDDRSWVESKLDAGESTTEYLAIRNLGKTTTTFALTAADGYLTTTGRFNMLQAGQESVDAGTWITVAKEVTVKAGGTEVVPFTITVPDNATPGDHPAGIAASVSTTGTTSDGTQIGVESRVGFRVMTQVTGDLAPALSIGRVTSEYTPSWNLFTPGKLSVSYEVTNAGNTQLSISDSLDAESIKRGDVFPGETRTISLDPVAAWPLVVISKQLTVAGSVPSDATLTVAPATETVSAIAIPWLHLAVLLGIIAVAAFLILARRRSSAKIATLLEQARAEGRREQAEAVRG